MRLSWNLVLVSLAVGCGTERNPAFCEDGVCVDPSRPYCDRDGALAGEPGQCIAVECAANAFEACTADGTHEIRCNGSGTTYDVKECALSCDAERGCIECETSEQCDAAAPICDPTSHSCRTCQDGAECPSLICNGDGTCMDSSSVIYAAPGGETSGACTVDARCALQHAIDVASANQARSTIHLADGRYYDSQHVPTIASGKLTLIGTDQARIGNTGSFANAHALLITGAAPDVTLRGVSLDARANQGVRCESTGSKARLRLEQVKIDGGFTKQDHCNVELFEVDATVFGDITSGCLTGGGGAAADRLDIERSVVRTPVVEPMGYLRVGGNCTSRIVNSVFDHVRVNVEGAQGTRGSLEFAFNTQVARGSESGGSAFDCSNATAGGIAIENNIMVAATTAMRTSAHCLGGIRNNIAFPQTTMLPPGNRVEDPLLIDVAAHDFHLKPTSPAIDAAAATSLGVTVDYDGVARPQGTAPDIGAFERQP